MRSRSVTSATTPAMPGGRTVLGMVNTAIDDDRTGLPSWRQIRHRKCRAPVWIRGIETARHRVPVFGDHAGEQRLAAPFGGGPIPKISSWRADRRQVPLDQVGIPHAQLGRVERNGEALAGILRFRSQLGLPQALAARLPSAPRAGLLVGALGQNDEIGPEQCRDRKRCIKQSPAAANAPNEPAPSSTTTLPQNKA